jgi:hypothetical protein
LCADMQSKNRYLKMIEVQSWEISLKINVQRVSFLNFKKRLRPDYI